MPAGIAARRRAEHAAWQPGDILKPEPGLDDLPPGERVAHSGEDHMVERVGADLEGLTQGPNSSGPQCAVRGCHGRVERAGDAMLRQQVRDAEVQWVPIIPTGSDAG